VASCPARADGIGYDQQALFTPGGVNDAVMFAIGTGNISGRFSVGDKVQILAELSLTGLSGANIKGIFASVSLPGSSGGPSIMSEQAENTAAQMATDGVYTIVSPEITIPLGCTGISWGLTLTAGAAGTALTAKLGRCSIEKV
jgi:hypothetical protein